MMEFGEKLRLARERKGFTQQTLADHLYVTRQAVSRWECGARYPELLTAKKIAAVLEVSLDELLSGEEFRPAEPEAPVLEQPVQGRMQTLLYAFAGLVFLHAAVYALLCGGALIQSLRSDSMTGLEVVGQVNVLRSAALSGLMLWAAVWSLRRKLTPARTAVVALAYYGLNLLTRWVSVLYLVDMGTPLPRTLLFAGVSTAAQGGCIAVIALYFFRKRQQSPVFVYLAAGLSLTKSLLTTVQVLGEMGIHAGTLFHVLTTLAMAAYCLLLCAQARTLEQKRLRALV